MKHSVEKNGKAEASNGGTKILKPSRTKVTRDEYIKSVSKMEVNKTQFQRRALCYKLLTLQYRQMFSTFLLLFVPTFGLAMIAFLRSITTANQDTLANISIHVPVPYFYNIPLQPLSTFEGVLFNVTDCNEWYMFSFADNVSEEDRSYFGRNEGLLDTPYSSGMLSSGTFGTNIMSNACKEVMRTVPYFKESPKVGSSYNETNN